MDQTATKYRDLQKLRSLLMKEIQAEFNGVPLTVEHHLLVEHRIANALNAGGNLTAMMDGTDQVKYHGEG